MGIEEMEKLFSFWKYWVNQVSRDCCCGIQIEISSEISRTFWVATDVPFPNREAWKQWTRGCCLFGNLDLLDIWDLDLLQLGQWELEVACLPRDGLYQCRGMYPVVLKGPKCIGSNTSEGLSQSWDGPAGQGGGQLCSLKLLCSPSARAQYTSVWLKPGCWNVAARKRGRRDA